MSTHRYALLAAALIAAAPALALAQSAPAPAPAPGPAAGPGRGQAAMFDRIDIDRDGRVTMEEVMVFVQGRFTAADRDGSGGLTQEELLQAMRGMAEGRRAERRAGAAAAPDAPRDATRDAARDAAPGGERAARAAEHAAMMFRMLDADRNGQVTLVEIRPVLEARFRGLDANGDGVVERSEMPQRQAGQHHHRGPGRGGPANPG